MRYRQHITYTEGFSDAPIRLFSRIFGRKGSQNSGMRERVIERPSAGAVMAAKAGRRPNGGLNGGA